VPRHELNLQHKEHELKLKERDIAAHEAEIRSKENEVEKCVLLSVPLTSPLDINSGMRTPRVLVFKPGGRLRMNYRSCDWISRVKEGSRAS